MKSLFVLVSGFTALAGAWLAIMECLLKHSGYQGRMTIGLLIALQGTAAALVCKSSNPPATTLRAILLVSAGGLAYVGVSALVRLVQQPHFEGFVLLIGAGIIVQAVLTTLAMLRPRWLP